MATTDYRELCKELFGTDNVAVLRKIALKVKTGNTRHAGRKRKFTDEDVYTMCQLLDEGRTINEVASLFKTSRQTVSRCVNTPLSKEYPLRITYMYQQRPTTVISVDFAKEKVKIQNRTEDVLHRAFGVIENPTWDDFNTFLKDRCFPATRGNAKQLLNQMGIGDYDPLQIVEKTAGRMAEDDLWMKFDYYKE